MHRRLQLTRHARIHLPLVLLVTSLLLALSAPNAVAWRATVLATGTESLDLGLLQDAPAVFMTFDEGAKPIELTSTSAHVNTLRVRLFAPDRMPERRLDGDELGSIEVVGVPQARFRRDAKPERLRDPSTGIRLRSIGSIDVPEPSATKERRVTLRVVPGSLPSRALLVAGPASEKANFELDAPQNVPNIVAQMRIWAETPPKGTPKQLLREPASTDDGGSTASVIIGAVVALAMVLLAGWWVLRGRAASRRRGAERRSPD